MRGRRHLDDLDDDIRDHLERVAQEFIEDGLSPEEAYHAARRAFGSVAPVQRALVYGRAFTVDDDRAGGPGVVILSHEFWTTRFGGEPSMVGRTITLGGAPHLVVGIVGPGFDTEQFDSRPDVYLPFQLDLERRDNGDLFLVSGRLKPGVTIDAASARLEVAFADYRRSVPEITFVSPGYFDVFHIPLKRGRTFTDRDTAGAPGVVIINEAMARQFWPDSDPLNDRLTIGRGMRPEYQDDPVRQIIGIVGNVRDVALRVPARPAMYVPMAQVPDSVNVLNLRLLPIAWNRSGVSVASD